MYFSQDKKKKIVLLKNILQLRQSGFSTTEMVVVFTVVGILATIIVPNFGPALEFVEVLIAEKYLLGAVKECQVGIANNESEPQYTLPNNDVGLGIFKNNKFVFSHTGIRGDCYPDSGGNSLRVTRINPNNGIEKYSLIINVTSGQKSYEGQVPGWLDWWTGKFSPIIK